MKVRFKKILGGALLLTGIVSIFFAQYIKDQVQEGKQQISSAEKKVQRGKKFFSLTPLSNPLGKGIANAAQAKINEGKEEVAYYEKLAGWLQTVGLLVGLGGIVLLIRFPSRKSSQ